MTSWNKTEIETGIQYPHELLQKYADSLNKETSGVLGGQVVEKIENEISNKAQIIYAFYVYLANLKQSYRLFEVEQIGAGVYPVNLNVFYYTGKEEFPNITDSDSLERQLDELIASKKVGALISHFIRLSELKDAE